MLQTGWLVMSNLRATGVEIPVGSCVRILLTCWTTSTSPTSTFASHVKKIRIEEIPSRVEETT